MKNIQFKYPNKLKEIRLKQGMTQKQVAEKLGLKCEDRISHCEKGQAIPSVMNLIRLSKILNTSVEQLFE